MCYILTSVCQACAFPIRTRHKPCSHAEIHGFNPLSCPNRMKRRRQSDAKVCGNCACRKGSLSCFPTSPICQDKDKSTQMGVPAVVGRRAVRSAKGRKSKRLAIKRREQQQRQLEH